VDIRSMRPRQCGSAGRERVARPGRHRALPASQTADLYCPYLELVIWSFSGVWSLVLGAFRSSCKELLNLMHHFRKPFDFRFRIVEIEARTRSRFYAELPHQRLRAVMSAAHRHAPLVGQGHDIVGVYVIQHEAHDARAARLRSEQAN